MPTATDLGAQELAPFFSSPLATLGATLAVTAIVLLLMSILPRLVTLLFRRLTPDWIDGLTTLMMVLLLLGQVTIMLRWLWPDLPYVWPLLLLLTIGIAAFLPANPISDSVAYLRLRRASPYQVWDLITVGKQQGRVAALRPLYTELISPTAERMRVPNSIILRRPLIVHSKAQPATARMSTPAALPAKQSQPSAMPAQAPLVTADATTDPPAVTTWDSIEPAVPNATLALPVAGTTSLSGTASLSAPPVVTGTIPPLRKRQGLGATSISGLIRT